jgi:hypothetical protein
MFKVFENALSQDTIDKVIEYFYSNPDQWIHRAEDAGVIKIDNPWENIKDIIQPELLKYFKAENGHNGWIYRHVWHYHIHADCFFEEPMVNILIPLFVPPEQKHKQSFMVFDQTTEWAKANVWREPDKPDAPFKIWYGGGGSHQRPCDDPTVHGCTDIPIDDKLYDAIGTDSKDFFHGLTGHILDFKPGNVIMFDSTHLHALGKMDSWKMGLVLHFWGTVETLVHDI